MKTSKILKIFVAIILLISIQTSVIAATTGVVNADTVRVREKPSTAADSDIIGLVSIGKKVTIIGQEDNWYKVKATDDHGNDIEGYIRKDLLTVDGEVTLGNETPTQTEEPNTNNGSTNGEETPNENPEEQPGDNNGVAVEKNDRTISTIKTSGSLYVGQKVQLSEDIQIKILPSANSSNIAKLSANTEITVLEVINSWCRIETGEYVGWVRIDQ